MIHEQPITNLLAFESYDAATATWIGWTGALRALGATRGGKRAGVTATVEVGILSAELVNAGDPLQDARLAPNVPVRIISTLNNEPIFTGKLVDLDVDYELDKSTGKTYSITKLAAADAVAAHNNTTRYGAVTDGGAGFESWANRIIRLAASSTTPINPPEDDDPIVRYAI